MKAEICFVNGKQAETQPAVIRVKRNFPAVLAAAQLPPGIAGGISANDIAQGISLVVPAYAGMAELDLITVRWGAAADHASHRVAAAEVGKPVAIAIPPAILAQAEAASGAAPFEVGYVVQDDARNPPASAPTVQAHYGNSSGDSGGNSTGGSTGGPDSGGGNGPNGANPAVGEAYGRGYGYYYDFGNDSQGNLTDLALLASEHRWKMLSSRNHHAIGILDSGHLMGWGLNDRGQVGSGSSDSRQQVPQAIAGDVKFRYAAAGYAHTLAIDTRNRLWVAGTRDDQALGLGALGDDVRRLQLVDDGSSWLMVDAANNVSIGIRSDGTLWAWGRNDYGQLAQGNTSGPLAPQRIGSASDWKYAAIGQYNGAAIDAQGHLYVWGYNGYGVLGTDAPPHNTTATTPFRPPATQDHNWVQVAVGPQHIVALTDDGQVWAWGNNDYGKTGTIRADGYGPGNYTRTPHQVGTAADWVSIAAGAYGSGGIRRSGGKRRLYLWGGNQYREILAETVDRFYDPVLVGSENDGTEEGWQSVCIAEYHMLGLKRESD
ncbi:RCC1 domain-containing protein [Chitinimonas koreensis]|uniref:RCC1 domain-containing protein n=1 Tax=Chitinimonas koreensis TaxID=356302 RepID=UPI0016541C5E|nr:hypothetical protein [Chitinimonas koreensis]QNM95672.1 hypothetical protein H9L41_17700 [Chitinimonas koreensis]